MRCIKCGRFKDMLAPTINRHSGTTHKACGKGSKTLDKDFYSRWQGMRERTSPYFWNRENYYDRGINSDAFASFVDFYDAMYESWKEHVAIYGVHDTSLERIDVNKPYTPENCTWICLDEQKGNVQKTIYFIVKDINTGIITYHKNARKYAFESKGEVPEKYIYDLIHFNRTYKGKEYSLIIKQDFEDYYKSVTTIENISQKKNL